MKLWNTKGNTKKSTQNTKFAVSDNQAYNEAEKFDPE